MKFADGFWLNQKGYEVNYAQQAFEVEPIENGFLVVATPFVVYNRAQMLGSAKAHSNSATIETNLRNGSVAIVRIGDKSLKIIMK